MEYLIREKRKLSFHNKRISPRLIRDFSSVVEDESNFALEEGDEIFRLFSLEAKDDSAFESSSSSIFGESSLIEKKAIHRINMRFYSSNLSKNIEIQLLHTENQDKENYIIVSGDNPIWVSGVLAKFAELLETSQPQPRVQSLLSTSMLVLLIILNILYFRITWPFVDPNVKNDFLRLLYALGFPLASILYNSYCEGYIKKIFPSVELQTGPEHMQIPKQKRIKLAYIFSVIIIPIILAIIYDIVRLLV